MKIMRRYFFIALLTTLLSGCTVVYKFNGASIDYTKTKTVSIADFPIRTANVYSPLSQAFSEGLRDIFQRQTRLRMVKQNGDLQFEGEITGYDFTPQAVKADAFASVTRLTLTVRVKYTNRVDPKLGFDQSFSDFRDFPSTKMPNEVQDQLIKELVESLTDQIYNASVANW